MSKHTLISWNVNGLRAVLKKNFHDFLDQYNPDVLCLQETKISSDLIDQFHFDHYPYSYWNCAQKKGYSGTAILSKQAAVSVQYGIGIEKHDQEGRVITADFEHYYLVTVYTPNSQNHDENKRPRRLDYRTLEWEVDFRNYVSNLQTLKPVIICGDLNVAHQDIDLANPSTNRKNAGFTNEERAAFSDLLAAGFTDSFRFFYPEVPHKYSWWSYRAAARKRNIGWRIDYFCCSDALKPQLTSAAILDQVMGSDHCPVLLKLSTQAA